MNQDVFIEKIVRRKKKPQDYLIFCGSIFLATLVFFAAMIFLADLFFGIAPLLIAGLIYLEYRVITGQNIEYEYIATNDDLTIDKIIARRKRKRVFSGSCKDFSIIAPITSRAFETQKKSGVKVIDCSADITDSNNWFFVAKKDNSRNLYVFEPDDRYINTFRRHNPRAIQD